jgi:hypothetical protein
MRKTVLGLVSAIVVVVALSGAFVVAAPEAEMRTARADVSTLSHGELATAPSKPAGPQAVDDVRDSVALVLVGSMLIGLAAAVRRTV